MDKLHKIKKEKKTIITGDFNLNIYNIYLKVVSTTFLLVCFSSLKQGTCET